MGQWEDGARGYVKNYGPGWALWVKITAKTSSETRIINLGEIQTHRQKDFDTGYMEGTQAPVVEFTSSCDERE